jgi:hypothetical protein
MRVANNQHSGGFVPHLSSHQFLEVPAESLCRTFRHHYRSPGNCHRPVNYLPHAAMARYLAVEGRTDTGPNREAARAVGHADRAGGLRRERHAVTAGAHAGT